MEKVEEKFFIGIDLGGSEKKTTGLCILKNGKIFFLDDIFGKDLKKIILPFLKDTQVIAIDAPLTKGRGKGKMRLYEKFLSTTIFRKAKINPLPPAIMTKFCEFAREFVKNLAKQGFILDINLIETFPTFIKKVCRKKYFLNRYFFKTENQESAFICAKVALFHSKFKTRYLGYKDGFLFLPEFSFWKKEWRELFLKAWKARPKLKYRYLITNIFS